MSKPHNNDFANYDDDSSVDADIGFSFGDLEGLNLDSSAYDTPQDKRIQQLENQLENSIIPRTDGQFAFRRFIFSSVGVEIPSDITPDELKDFLLALREADDAIAWTVGDLANHANTKWGQKYEELEQMTGYKYATLRDYAYIANAVDLSIRIDKLKFSHHRVVAAMPHEQQKKWLAKCAKYEWSVSEFKQQIAQAQRSPKTTISDALHRDKKPKFAKVEIVLNRALTTGNETDIEKAREQLYQSRKAAETYFDALEAELKRFES